MPGKIVDPSIYNREYFLGDNEGWKEWHSGLDGNMHPKFQRALELAAPLHGKSVLDIGCGRAELIYYCVKRGARAHGIDYSAAAIELAKETISRLPQELAMMAKATVGEIGTFETNENYDVVFMVEIAEHMYGWQLKEAFEKILDMLKPGGTLIVMTPNYLYEKILLPIKRIVNIPLNLIKWPLRIIRGKYSPKSFGELMGRIFKVRVDRGELNRKMHVNVTTPGNIRRYLSEYDAKVWCEDPSRNILSLLTGRWWGREIIAVAVKRKGDI
ncbi:MAG: class I SAM-dependent methyltransferase [Candidatus Omnitrophica bacterium]|nr:class I SAM-dependent methyltransferase [Candidatus Omnitrophota bacterium]